MKLHIHSPNNPAITILNIIPREIKMYVHIKTNTQMFMEALLIPVKNLKQPEVLLWVNVKEIWFMPMEFYCAIIRS